MVTESPAAKLTNPVCFCQNLRRTTRAVTRVYEEEFRTVGFTGATQYSVLSAIGRMESVRQADLSEALDLDETTVTRTLKPLLDKGWITQTEGEDRREKWVALTKAGKEQILRAKPAWERAQSRLKSVLPPGVWDVMLETLPEVARLTESA